MTQRLFPNADVSTGSWTKSGGSFFYEMIDEAVDTNDGSGTYVSNTTTSDILKVSLSSGGKPADLAGWFIRFAWMAVPVFDDIFCFVELRDGGTLIATAVAGMTALEPYGFEVTIEYELTPDEAQLISSLDNLELWAFTGGGQGEAVLITAKDLLIPDAQIIEPLKYGYI